MITESQLDDRLLPSPNLPFQITIVFKSPRKSQGNLAREEGLGQGAIGYRCEWTRGDETCLGGVVGGMNERTKKYSIERSRRGLVHGRIIRNDGMTMHNSNNFIPFLENA